MTHLQSDERLRTEGMADELEGKAKEAWGQVTGDVSDELAGKAEQAWGKAQQGAAEVMDEVGDAADAVDDR